MNIISYSAKTLEDSAHYDINIVHLLIGCKTPVERRGGIIHEFPKLVRILLTDPEILFDPSMISFAYSKKELRIRQVLFLIDPEYKKSKPAIANSAIMEMSNSGQNTILSKNSYMIASSIETFIYPENTSEPQMSLLINIFSQARNTIINIQDTTGSDMCKKWRRKPYIHILPSDCSLNTSEIYACPPIKYLNSPKWVNLEEDSLKILLDPYNGDEYVIDYLKAIAKFILVKYELVALSRLWSLTEMREPINHILNGQTYLDQITNINFNANNKFCIRPYIEYRCEGNIAIDWIKWFLDFWADKYMYTKEDDQKISFVDMIKEQCDIRIKLLGDNTNVNTYRDLVNIITRNIIQV